ncbi:T9SS type A sorting domain-containing protein [Wocania ichthyoenteri]|uniref:T9SS type A sorting domain-containing protein n=1 Tax=Wocania ichthyoenteri TaxID=1230531 RepID=UPI00053D88C6|nr:T9SS type A sorting domain-containing protein [Wocania ichthyoenteri]
MTKKLLIFITLSLIGFTGNTQCLKPYQIDTNNKTTNSITLTWNSGNNSLTGNFEIEYGLKNFSFGTGTKISSSFTAIQINNLNSNTQYDFYVTNNCGSTPTTSDVYQNVTSADYCNGDLFFDPGFEENYVGTYYESYNLRPNSSDKRISLDFELFELSPDATLKIWEGSYALGDPIVVYDNNTLPSEPIISRVANGELYIVFESNNSQNNAPGWIGNVSCIDKPQCNSPRFISPTNITYNSITLSWVKSTTNRTYIEYGLKNFEIGTGEKVETYTNTITISSLSELTEYDFYLTEECDDSSLSDTKKATSISTKPFCESTISFRRLDSYKLNQIELTGVNIDLDLNEEWQLEYGLKGFTLGEGTTENYSSNDVIVENLQSDTEYDFYLRNKCGERFSTPIGPFSEKTNIDYCFEGKIYDRGGRDKVYTDYQYTRDFYIHLRDNKRARIKVNSVRLGSYEEIKIYDGPDSNSPLLKHLHRNSPSSEFVSSGNSNVIFFDIINNYYNYSDIKWDIDITCEATPNCEEATNFQVNNFKLSHNQCELNWTKTSNLNDSYSIEYGLEGFERGTGTIVQTNEDFITLDNLNKSTSYQAYVTTVCAEGGQDNIYVEPLTFKTTPNFFGGDKFTDDGGIDNNIPENQTKITTIYPKAQGERIRVNFDYIDLMRIYNNNALKLYSGTDTNSGLIVELRNANDLENKGVSFYSHDPNGAITVEFTSSTNPWYHDYYSRGWEADVISELIPDCSEPFNISTTNFTHQEISLAWEAETDVSEWKIEYGLAGFNRGNGIIKNTLDKNISIIGLSPDTEYDFYISSKCDNGNFNDYAPAYKDKTRKDFSNGVLLTSNDDIEILYPDNIGERIRIEFTYFNIKPYLNQSTVRSEVVINFLNEQNGYNYYSCYAFRHDSNLYPVVSEKEDGSLSYFQKIDGTSYWEAKVYSEPKPTCGTTNEKDFLFQRLSHNEVELVWAKNDDNILYKVEYGPVGFLLGTGFTKEFDNTRQFLEEDLRRPYHTYKTEKDRFDENLIYYSIILDDLEENTEYEFYITTMCPDGFINTYPVPKLIKTTKNLLNEGIYHANSSGQMRQRKAWTILGQLENTAICPNSDTERIVATVKRLDIPQYTGGDPFTVIDGNNTRASNSVLFSTFSEIPFIKPETVLKADNESGCLTFNFSHANSTSFAYLPETIEDWNSTSTWRGWIVEISSEPKNSLNVKDIDDTKNIQIYPNPSEDYFFIKSNLDLKIKEIIINDITGRSVKKYFNTNFNQKLYFDLPSGTYFVNIKTENKNTSVKKIIVK